MDDSVPPWATNIVAILQAAHEIEDQDPNVARILCEQVYQMVQTLNPNREGIVVLEFKTDFSSDLKPMLLRKGWSTIDRSNDIEHLWDFYRLYKQKHLVEDIQREEEKWRQTGVLSSNVKQLTDVWEVFATLKALIVVMEHLSTRAASGMRISIMVMDELRRTNAPNPPHSNATTSGWIPETETQEFSNLTLLESSTSHPQIEDYLTPVEVSMQNKAPKVNESKDKDQNLCVVCWDSAVEGACIPCGHMAGCMSCLNQIKSEKGDCPVCRAKINLVLRIYAL